MAILATLSLAGTLAFGGTMVGCGSSNSGSSSGGTDSGSDTSNLLDGGKDSNVVDSNVPDTFVLDTGTTADTGTQPDTSLPAAATPTCSPAAGTFTSAQAVTLADSTTGATIFYTTDGTNPNQTSQVFASAINVTQTEQIRAYATAPGFSASDVVSCQYTINIQPGQCQAPTAAPATGTYNNDFPATLTTPTAGCNICFTLDGSQPSCNPDGSCVAPAKAYDAQARIPINGTVTGTPSAGEVTVNAIACGAGMTSGVMPAAVTYTLQVAAPTLEGPTPDPTAHLYTGSGIAPTVASTTNGATGLFTMSAGILSTDPNGTSCTNGTPITGAGGNTLLPQQISETDKNGNLTLFVVGCKAGYLASTETIAPYTFTLNAPNVGASVQPGTYDAVVDVTVADSLNVGASGEFVCATTDGSAAACNGATCAAGQQKLAAGSQVVFPTDKRAPAGTPPAGDLNVNGEVVNEIACSAKYAQSAPYSGTAYNLQLDKIAFQCCAGLSGSTFANACTTPTKGTGFGTCDAAHDTIPNGGKVWIEAAETVVAGQETYDFICSTTDPATTPDCTCDPTNVNLTKSTTFPVVSTGFAAAGTFKAVGCLNPTTGTGNGGLGDQFVQSDTPFASQSATATGGMTAPGIVSCAKAPNTTCSANPLINNPQQVEFVNNNATGSDSAYFCYTINNSAPGDIAGPPPKCFNNGTSPGTGNNTSANTYCTKDATAPGATSDDGPYGTSSANKGANAALGAAITTGQWIHAIACDSSTGQPLTPSSEGSPVQFELIVGNPTILGGSAVSFGEAVTITSATAGASINYSTDGTTPDCTTNFASVTTGNTADANGLFDATYWAMGAENAGKPLTVIGCKAGYTVSAGTANVTFSYSAAQPQVLYTDGANEVAASHSVTYDDYLGTEFEEPPTTGGGASGTWFCAGSTPGCSPTVDQCTGSGSLALGGGCTNVTLTGATAHSAGQPTGTPVCSIGGLTLPDTFLGGIIPNLVACVPAQPGGTTAGGTGATAAVSASPGQGLNFDFQNSATALTSAANMTSSGSVTFAGVKTNTPPDGDHNPPAADILGATGGNGSGGGEFSGTSYICGSSTQTIASLGGQPSSCSAFVSGTPANGWSCQASAAGNSGLGGAGPTLTFTDQGINATYAFFNCKDEMTWTTGSAAVTFTPYVHTPTFTMTGAPSDFTASEGPLGGADGAQAYVTFDATNLYVGFNLPAGIGNTDIIHFYVGSKNGSGTSAPDSVFPTGGADLPATTNTPATPVNFNGLYHVYWKADNTAHGTDKWTGAAWAADGDPAAVVHNSGSKFVEFSVSLATLAGTAGSLHLLGGDWTGAAQAGAWPSDNADTGATPTPTWTAFQSEDTSYAFAPNDTKLQCDNTCAASNVGETCCLQ